jgi:hypothetical protein
MNNRGIALILCYMVILVLTIFASAFVTSTISENTISTRQTDSTKAFWIAEAGLNEAYYNYKNYKKDNKPQPKKPVKFSGGTYTIDASNLLAVKVTGTFGRSNAQRTIQASFVAIPKPFQNTLSVGGDLVLSGEDYLKSSLSIDGKTRISGRYRGDTATQVYFENFKDKDQGVTSEDTTLKIPDYNHNGKPDEYADFVQMGRQIVDSYAGTHIDFDSVDSYIGDEVIYLKADDYVCLYNESEISGKKVIFLEGSREGMGGTFIYNPPLKAGDDITVISTGNICYYVTEQMPTDARLSSISWKGYQEVESSGRGQGKGVIYTHGGGYWDYWSPRTSSLITGNVIVNQGAEFRMEGTRLQFHYSDRVLKGDIPPGVKWLFDTEGASKSMVDWQEAE